MKLSEFVSETINEIIDGVVAAQIHGKEQGAAVNPVYATLHPKPGDIYDASSGQVAQWIEFDVAVTTSDVDQSKGGLGVFVGAFGAGAQGQTETTNSTSNRIRFSVPVFLPAMNAREVKK